MVSLHSHPKQFVIICKHAADVVIVTITIYTMPICMTSVNVQYI